MRGSTAPDNSRLIAAVDCSEVDPLIRYGAQGAVHVVELEFEDLNRFDRNALSVIVPWFFSILCSAIALNCAKQN